MVYATLLSEEDLSRFRTKQCKRLLNGGCNFGLDRCQYSHNEFWNRRCPFYLSDSSFIRYITVMCPDVEVGTDGSINSTCLRGGECPFSHSLEEILYHPLFYKTTRCEDYKRGTCNTYYCPFIHGLAETRVPGKYKLPFTNGIQIPPIPNVVIVDKIELQANTNNSSNHREFTSGLENEKGNGNEREIAQKDKERHWKQSQKKRDSRIEPTEGGINIRHMNKSNNYSNDVGCNGLGGNNISTLINGIKTNGRKESNGNTTTEEERNNVSVSSENAFKISQDIFRNSNGTKPTNSSFTTLDNHMELHSTENLNDLFSNRLSMDTFIGTNMNHSSVHASTVIGSYRESEVHKSSVLTERRNGDSFCCTDNGRNSFLTPFQNMKMKQRFSSSGTVIQDPVHIEPFMTNEDIDDREEENSKTFAYLKNGQIQESQKILEQNYLLERENLCKLENSKESGNKSSELNLLEVVKCLQSLHEKIIKGNLVFTPDQWDMIAQVTYEIIGVIEFNRVMKLKNKQNNRKGETNNLINSNGGGEPIQHTSNSPNVQNMTNKFDIEIEKEKKEVEEMESKKERNKKEPNTNNIIDSRLMESLTNINFNLKNDNGNQGRIMIEEKSGIFNFYQQNKNNPLGFDKMSNGLNGKCKSSDLCFPIEENNINMEKNSQVKDTIFMEYFNLHKDQVNWPDSKENPEKLSTQNQFTSFFSFLSE